MCLADSNTFCSKFKIIYRLRCLTDLLNFNPGEPTAENQRKPSTKKYPLQWQMGVTLKLNMHDESHQMTM